MVMGLPIFEETRKNRMADQEKFDPDESLPYLIVRLGHQLSQSFGELMGSVGLSARQFGILGQVMKEDGVGSAQLARRFGVTPQSAGDQVEILVDRGLLKRDKPGPGRKAGIHLTAKGRKTFLEAVALADAYNAKLTGHIGAKGLARCKADLEELGRQI
jgi:DNA-binding MarR family transcriptional regulator